jgi:Helix-turn-helix domain
MARFSVPARRAIAAVLTTTDVARALQVTRHGVRYLVQAGELVPAVTAATGQWVFSRVEVERVAEARLRRRLRSAGQVWRALRLVARSAEPRQLALPLYGDRRRKGTTHTRIERPGNQRGFEPVPISSLTDTRGAARRMAKADLYEHRHAHRAAGRQ